MKELKRYAILPLIVAMAACGGGDGAPPADEAQQPAAEAAPAAEAPAMNLPEGVTPAMVAEGETLFMGSGICFTCHMQGGVGGPNAPNLTDEVWLNVDGSYDAIVQLVMTGVAQPKEHPGLMLPKGGSSITDEQVRAVAAYVWTLSPRG